LSVRRGEELFGRHGDIKPENILWFDKGSCETQDAMGVLQITDYGLGRFHGRDSHSQTSPGFGSLSPCPTYEPPESKLRLPVSRNYDIWSLGCLYLDFITWLLKGSAEIGGFSDFRGHDDPQSGLNDDAFFTINRDGTAKLREEVVIWVNQLHEHDRCSQLIHDLMDLVMNDLLIVESKERGNAASLFQQLKMYLKKAEENKDYLLKPVPRSQKRSDKRSHSESRLEESSMKPRDLTTSDSGHSDTESEAESLPESVLSNAASTISSQGSISPAIGQSAADDFTTLLLKDEALSILFRFEVQNEKIGGQRFERNFRRLLIQYAIDLRREAESIDQKSAAAFVQLKSRYIANNIRRTITVGENEALDMEKIKSQQVDRQVSIERYLQEMLPEDDPPSPHRNDMQFLPIPRASPEDFTSEDSNSESEIEEPEPQITLQEHEPFPVLSRLKNFMVSSVAFSSLKENLHEFIYPSFQGFKAYSINGPSQTSTGRCQKIVYLVWHAWENSFNISHQRGFRSYTNINLTELSGLSL
jgi:serine/threonine protein kinase